MNPSSRISIDDLKSQFQARLRASDTSPDAPELLATWRAFGAFADTQVEGDDESLFFECGLSPCDEDRFYVNFTRTFFGRDAGNHFWSCELNCDFQFQSDENLEDLGLTIEAEELAEQPQERLTFFERVNAQKQLWDALAGRESLVATIYVGES